MSPRKNEVLIHSRLKKVDTLINTGQLTEAEQILSGLGQADPRVTSAWLQLASYSGQQGMFQKVVDCCQRVLAIHPRHPTALNLIGSAHASMENYSEAIEYLTAALQLDPDNPGILNNRGNVLFADGQIEAAEEHYRKALQLNPNHAPSHIGLGKCFLEKGLWIEAVGSYQKAHHAMPDDYDVNIGLGKAYQHLGSFEEAIKCFMLAQTLTDQPGCVLNELAAAECVRGNLEQALEYTNQSLQHLPDSPDTLTEQANINYRMGNIEAAHKQIRSLLDKWPKIPRIVQVYSFLCHHFDECADAVALAENILADKANISTSDQINLRYVLGGLYDKMGNYDTAFHNYKQANELVPGRFDRERHAVHINQQINAYSQTAFPTLPRSVWQDQRPVFIIGMPRSGTSLVEQILASHPAVYGAGELEDIRCMAIELCQHVEGNYTEHLQSINQELLNNLANRYLIHLGNLAGDAERVTNKLPANFMFLGLIAQLFPGARIIHCRRDPRDTCLSIYFQQFGRWHDYSNDLGDLSYYYRQYERIMDHWRTVLDIPLLEITYEKLVMDTKGHAQEMVDFLGLDWDERCLDFHRSGRITATASFDQVRQPVYTKSTARWKNYQQHLGPLIAEFGDNEISLNAS